MLGGGLSSIIIRYRLILIFIMIYQNHIFQKLVIGREKKTIVWNEHAKRVSIHPVNVMNVSFFYYFVRISLIIVWSSLLERMISARYMIGGHNSPLLYISLSMNLVYIIRTTL